MLRILLKWEIMIRLWCSTIRSCSTIRRSGRRNLNKRKPSRRDDIFWGIINIQANIQTFINQHQNLRINEEDIMDDYQNASQRATTFIGNKHYQFWKVRIRAKVDRFINRAATIIVHTCFERLMEYTTTPR